MGSGHAVVGILDSDASFLFGLVLGIFVGAAVALVLTPASGPENRARLMDKAQGAKGELEGRTRETM